MLIEEIQEPINRNLSLNNLPSCSGLGSAPPKTIEPREPLVQLHVALLLTKQSWHHVENRLTSTILLTCDEIYSS